MCGEVVDAGESMFSQNVAKSLAGAPQHLVELQAREIEGVADCAAGLFTPRAHVRSLLGGDAVMALSGRASAAALVMLVIALSALAVARARRV